MDAPIARWIAERARPLHGTGPDLPLDDLEPLRPVATGAAVVGIGEATRFAHEVFDVRVRLLRFLVERLGFGVLALEDRPDVGARLDDWVHGAGTAGPEEILDDAWAVFRTEEFVATLHRLRADVRDHPERDVRIAGITAPDARPSSYDPADTAARIVAEHEASGRPVVYWGGTGHTAVHRPEPGWPPHPFPRTDGTHLRDRLGARYVSVGVTFDRGRAPRWTVAPASEGLAEHALAGSDRTRLLDLTGPVPDAVASWLDAPTRARMIGPSYDPSRDLGHSIAGTPLRVLFDVLVHVPEVGPVTPLPDRDAARAAGPGSR